MAGDGIIDLSREIVFGSADAVVSRRISGLEKKGVLRKIAPRIYTTNLHDAPENIVRRNLFDIVAWRLPGGVISHRSAYEMAPTPTGDFFLTASSERVIADIPGIRLNVSKGAPPLENDIRLGGASIYVSSEYRRALEILQPSRKAPDEAKSLPASFIEGKIEKMMAVGGEKDVNDFRDRAREVAAELGMGNEFGKLNKIVSALLNTHPATVLTSDSAKALAAGVPYDAERARLFEVLFNALQNDYFATRDDANTSVEAFRNFAFFESYFSNYIEGTEFEVGEAKQIVDTGRIIPNRSGDSHDILGTFNVVSNKTEMQRTPATEDEFLSLLQRRHAAILRGRPDMDPGGFKTRGNRAGDSVFVAPERVEGTLRHGFKLYRALTSPLARAVYMMFLCSEVHPFNDGNGRVSRIMMNAELVAAGQTRIIVPTVFRDDYILSLRRLTRSSNPAAYIKAMSRLQEFCSRIDASTFDGTREFLERSNAFKEPDEARLIF